MANTPKKTPADTDQEVSVTGPSAVAASGAPVSDEGAKLKTEPTPKAIKAVTLDARTMLIAKALELNIEVDEDWNEDRLRAEIQMAREGRADLQVKGAVPPKGFGDPDYDRATKTDKALEGTPIVLERDYWNAQEERLKAGTKLNVSREEAEKLIASGAAKRGDPLPG